MFVYEKNVWKSTLLDMPRVGHAFSTRLGGISVNPHTRSMNVGFGRGDDDDTVRANIEILCRAAGISYDGLVGSPQFHTTAVRYVTSKNAGEGITKDCDVTSDGFVTDSVGTSLIVRTADCTPILLAGEKADGSPVVGAAHAGWKGTVGGIAKNLVEKAIALGAEAGSVRAAIGPCIGKCHFEVKDDFIEAVRSVRGADFAKKYIELRDGKYFCDMIGMNVETLTDAGIPADRIDISFECTFCSGELYHSHRLTKGVRGTMGNVIGILQPLPTF